MQREHLAAEVVDRDEGLLLRFQEATGMVAELVQARVTVATAADVASAVAQCFQLDVDLFALV